MADDILNNEKVEGLDDILEAPQAESESQQDETAQVEITETPVDGDDTEYIPEIPEIVDPTKVLIALMSDNEKLAVTAEQFGGYDMHRYSVCGIIIRNEDCDVDILVCMHESLAAFGNGPVDIPETDRRRRNALPDPVFPELDGEQRTAWQKMFHPETHADGCAICDAEKLGWLPSCGEMSWLGKYQDAINELAELVDIEPLADDLYWTSTQYSEDYMWSYNMDGKRCEFWHSKATRMRVRPVNSAAGYSEIEAEEITEE